MTFGYPRSDMVLGLKGQRLGLGLTAICRHMFELYECLLVISILLYCLLALSTLITFLKLSA